MANSVTQGVVLVEDFYEDLCEDFANAAVDKLSLKKHEPFLLC